MKCRIWHSIKHRDSLLSPFSVFLNETTGVADGNVVSSLCICSSGNLLTLFSSYQDDRERKLKNMEERMKEVELSLHNVKLLLREKVAQLNEQVSFVQVTKLPPHSPNAGRIFVATHLSDRFFCVNSFQRHKNGKADVLINDLYVENAQLLKALEITEQRQKIAEKKNYLLEEKISSLNKIVRDLNPSSLSPLPFHYKCSQWRADVNGQIRRKFILSWTYHERKAAQEKGFFLCYCANCQCCYARFVFFLSEWWNTKWKVTLIYKGYLKKRLKAFDVACKYIFLT